MANDIEVIKLIIVLLIIQIWKKCALYYFKLSFQFRQFKTGIMLDKVDKYF